MYGVCINRIECQLVTRPVNKHIGFVPEFVADVDAVLAKDGGKSVAAEAK
jgi:hypothetical protein